MGSEKRRQPRIASELSVRLRHARRDSASARTIQNVSVGGIACYSDEPVPTGDRVAVEMAIGEQHFQLQGRVVWCRGGTGGRYELGLRFEEEPADSRERLCHDLAEIERYRHEVLMLEGRQLSSDAAAQEWISAGSARV
jgi:hypothetical protein